MSPREAVGRMSDNASLSIRELKFTGAGRWLTVMILVMGGAGGGAAGMYGVLEGSSGLIGDAASSNALEAATGEIRSDVKEVRARVEAMSERMARVETILDEMRRRETR